MAVFRVFLRSGESFDVFADRWDVVNHEFQEADDDSPPRRQIFTETLGFYDEDGDEVSCGWYVPFTEVVAVISTDGGGSIDLAEYDDDDEESEDASDDSDEDEADAEE